MLFRYSHFKSKKYCSRVEFNKIELLKNELLDKIYKSNNKEVLIGLAKYFYDYYFESTNSYVDKCIEKLISISDPDSANKILLEYNKIKEMESE